MTRLVVWRHGRSEWNAVGRVQGHADIDLDDEGLAQAAGAAPRLAAYRPDLVLSSDLRRAARTADALAAITGLTIEYDPRLRERNFGPWQGLTPAEIKERYPVDYARWGRDGPFDDPAIETVDDMAKRVLAAFRDSADRIGPGGTAVLVTHGGAARAGCGSLLGWPQDIWRTLGGLHNCALSELRHTPARGWQLLRHNVV
jgi:glucosyl-3-phosphoglycerate phosphatase